MVKKHVQAEPAAQHQGRNRRAGVADPHLERDAGRRRGQQDPRRHHVSKATRRFVSPRRAETISPRRRSKGKRVERLQLGFDIQVHPTKRYTAARQSGTVEKAKNKMAARLKEKYQKEIKPALAEGAGPREPDGGAAAGEDRRQHGSGRSDAERQDHGSAGCRSCRRSPARSR